MLRPNEHRATWALGFAVILASCTTLVEVDFPTRRRGVMEASVRLGEPPAGDYKPRPRLFDPLDLSTLNDLFVNAEVTCTVDGVTVPLPALCTGTSPEALEPRPISWASTPRCWPTRSSASTLDLRHRTLAKWASSSRSDLVVGRRAIVRLDCLRQPSPSACVGQRVV